MNLYKSIPSYADQEANVFNVVIEITKWSSNKIEYNEEEWYFYLDRALYHSMYYPFDYGFIPQTTAGDGDAVDVILLLTHSVFPGCVVKSRIIWAVKTSDQDGEDRKIIAVPISKLDPRRDEVKSYTDLPAHYQEELLLYFKEYKKLEKQKYDKILIGWFVDEKTALEHIVESMETYEKNHS
jgi:inorganic pyrophosphatase